MKKRLAVIALSILLATPALADDQTDVLQPLEAKNGGLNIEDKYSKGVGGAPTANDNMAFASLRYYWQ